MCVLFCCQSMCIAACVLLRVRSRAAAKHSLSCPVAATLHGLEGNHGYPSITSFVQELCPLTLLAGVPGSQGQKPSASELAVALLGVCPFCTGNDDG
jgi:hypothetical protein